MLQPRVLIARSSYNQGFFYNQGFLHRGVLQPGILTSKEFLQPGVLPSRGLTSRGSYSQESYSQEFLHPEVLTTRGLTTKSSYTRGFWQPGVLQHEILKSADVCCHITVIRRLMSYVWYQTSDVSYPISDIRCLMSMMFVVWCQTSHVRCLISNVRYDIRCLMFYYITSDFRHPTSYNCYQTSDVWYQTSDMTSNVWYQTNDIRHLILVMMSNV